ncbi:AAA family ATPase [Sunxiuqinia sp. A32]|uniref:AAA family ATPase n=1 Tax=Sunxiuqinia sp. A32 TaxID=3461496 RepID=UPI004046694E
MNQLEKQKNTPIRTANQRIQDAQKQPDMFQLLGPIWFTGEIIILFADTGIGKSIFGIQIGNGLSKGTNVTLSLKNECEPQNVLYYDFELSDKQFQKRYSDEKTGQVYQFSNNFYIDNVDFVELYDQDPKKNFLELIFEKFKRDIIEVGVKILIVDNITFLNTQTTQDQQASLDIMRKLVELKKEYGLSILVLAHTPKRSDEIPITISDLSGSKQLSNFADSVFAIGKSSKGPSNRYIKQVKPSRSSELIYHSGNVLEFGIDKDDSFLQFIEIGTGTEKENLNISQDDPKLMALSLKNSDPTLSIRKIAQMVGKSKSTVAEWLKESPHWKDYISKELDTMDTVDKTKTTGHNGHSGL